MHVSIIKADPVHSKEIAKICASGWRQTVQNKGVFSEEYQRKNVEYWYNDKQVQNDIINGVYTHVAMIDSNVVGVIGGIMTEQSMSEIYVFYVDDQYRYQGIGRQLLDAFTNAHIGNGATEQYASVQEGNHLGIPFYEARGFQQTGENNEKTNAARFWRQLADQDT